MSSIVAWSQMGFFPLGFSFQTFSLDFRPYLMSRHSIDHAPSVDPLHPRFNPNTAPPAVTLSSTIPPPDTPPPASAPPPATPHRGERTRPEFPWPR